MIPICHHGRDFVSCPDCRKELGAYSPKEIITEPSGFDPKPLNNQGYYGKSDT